MFFPLVVNSEDS